jgi:AraC-like DNA-binding protein
VRACESWLEEHFRELGAVARVVAHARLPELTLKRRFKHATGLALIDYLQNLRIEEAKCALESSDRAVDESVFKPIHRLDQDDDDGDNSRRGQVRSRPIRKAE